MRGIVRDVVSIGSSKEAALYFDRVFPDEYLLSHSMIASTLEIDEKMILDFNKHQILYDEVLLNLNPDYTSQYLLYHEHFVLSAAQTIAMSCMFGNIEHTISYVTNNLPTLAEKYEIDFFSVKTNEDAVALAKIINRRRWNIVKKLGFSNAPIWMSGASEDRAPDAQHESIMITVAKLKLIDVTSLEWKSICEFRQDEDSRTDLRKLRVFLGKNFEDSDRNFIEDSLHQAVYDYDKTVKKWGFETTHKSLSVAFDSRSLIAAAVGGFATIMAGAPLGVAAAASIAVPVGRLSLEFSKSLIDLASIRHDSPVSYISRMRNKTNELQ